MRLDEWIKREKLTNAAAGRLFGVSGASVGRYQNRVPEPEVVVRIYVATGGQVQPNDFYSLPEIHRPAAKRRAS